MGYREVIAHLFEEREQMRLALEKIAAMDPEGVRADDLGRAARIARLAEFENTEKLYPCAKCGCETKGEVAFVRGEEWCHPCADEAITTPPSDHHTTQGE